MTDRHLMGQVALDLGLITPEQLRLALEEKQRTPEVPLGTTFLKLGYLGPENLQLLLNAQLRRLEEKAAVTTLRRRALPERLTDRKDAAGEARALSAPQAEVPGCTLRDLLSRQRLSAERAVQIVHDVAQVVASRAGLGGARRGLTPTRIWIDARGDVSLSAAGGSFLPSPESRPAVPTDRPTRRSSQSIDRVEVERAVARDLGQCLFEALLGHPSRKGRADARDAWTSGPARDLPLEIAWMLRKALPPGPEGGYGSPRELADDLGRYLQGLAPDGAAGGAHRFPVPAAGMLLLLVLSVVLWLLASAPGSIRLCPPWLRLPLPLFGAAK